MKTKRLGFLTRAFLITFVFACAVLSVKFYVDGNEYYAMTEENNEIIAAEQDKNDEMKDALAEPKDEKYYQDKARDKLNLRLPEEIIFYNDLIN